MPTSIPGVRKPSTPASRARPCPGRSDPTPNTTTTVPHGLFPEHPSTRRPLRAAVPHPARLAQPTAPCTDRLAPASPSPSPPARPAGRSTAPYPVLRRRSGSRRSPPSPAVTSSCVATACPAWRCALLDQARSACLTHCARVTRPAPEGSARVGRGITPTRLAQGLPGLIEGITRFACADRARPACPNPIAHRATHAVLSAPRRAWVKRCGVRGLAVLAGLGRLGRAGACSWRRVACGVV